MGRIVASEWADSLCHWRFWIVAAALIAIFAFSIVDYEHTRSYFAAVRVTSGFFNGFDAYLQALGRNGQSLFILFLPVFAALPRGDVVPTERQWGGDAVQLTRVGWTSYVWGKWLGNVATVACLMVLGLICAFALSAILYPLSLPHVIGVAVPAHPLPLKDGVYENGYAPVFERSLYFANPVAVRRPGVGRTDVGDGRRGEPSDRPQPVRAPWVHGAGPARGGVLGDERGLLAAEGRGVDAIEYVARVLQQRQRHAVHMADHAALLARAVCPRGRHRGCRGTPRRLARDARGKGVMS